MHGEAARSVSGRHAEQRACSRGRAAQEGAAACPRLLPRRLCGAPLLGPGLSSRPRSRRRLTAPSAAGAALARRGRWPWPASTHPPRATGQPASAPPPARPPARPPKRADAAAAAAAGGSWLRPRPHKEEGRAPPRPLAPARSLWEGGWRGPLMSRLWRLTAIRMRMGSAQSGVPSLRPHLLTIASAVGAPSTASAMVASFEDFDFEGDERWAAYLARLDLAAVGDQELPRVVRRLQAKWYRCASLQNSRRGASDTAPAARWTASEAPSGGATAPRPRDWRRRRQRGRTAPAAARRPAGDLQNVSA